MLRDGWWQIFIKQLSGGGVSRMRIVDTKKHAGRIKSSINCPCCVFPIKQSWKPGFDGIKGVELIYVLWVDRYHSIELLICWLIDWLIKELSTFLHLMFRLLRADQQQLRMSHSLKSFFFLHKQLICHFDRKWPNLSIW